MIEAIYSNRKNFIVIGLTGRIGSGCTTAAEFLSEDKTNHKFNNLSIDDDSKDSDRKRFIIDKFYKENWKPFTTIRATDIIFTYLLKYDFEDFNKILESFNEKVHEAHIELDKDEPNLQHPEINLYKRINLYGEIIQLDESFKEVYNAAHEKFKNFYDEIKSECEPSRVERLYQLITVELIQISDSIRKTLGKESYKNFTDIFQLLGDNIRLYGDIQLDESKKSAKNIYTIPESINDFIKIIKRYNDANDSPTLIAIDAIRNSLESMFFKERYSSFYLFAINAEDEHIEDRLHQKTGMTREDIRKQSKKEHQEKSLASLENFVSQNIQDCISKSDIYIVNNGKYDEDDFKELHGQLVKYVSLIMHPGLITPSVDEKMMQFAYTAKLNSGCISRQVGASITNQNGSLKAVGWNSVAEGQTPCLLRSVDDLHCNSKSKAYSTYEQSREFKDTLEKEAIIPNTLGLNQSFCFKSIYTSYNPKEIGNQVHTRSLHAEENAFLQLAKYGGEGIKGGKLYTTASPCELCAKKAYQLGIKDVIYIDPYPGIARQQILMTGLYPPNIKLFSGAVGVAYHKLFEQIIPYKDELANLA